MGGLDSKKFCSKELYQRSNLNYEKLNIENIKYKDLDLII